MFGKDSRYFNVPVSRRVSGTGERVLGTDLRVFTPVPGRFLHCVSLHDRLDLLAFKFYNNGTRWWLIADANPGASFPLDLLDTAPIIEEELVLFDEDRLNRLAQLNDSLRSLSADSGILSDFEAATIRVSYTASPVRGVILSEIVRLGFTAFDSSSWIEGPTIHEVFQCEDRLAKVAWNRLLTILRPLPGMIETVPLEAGRRLKIRYNEVRLERVGITAQIESQGFRIDPRASRKTEQLGSRIIIPPNQA